MSRSPAAVPSAAPQPTACFSIQAYADPGVMPRVLELFTKRGLIPTTWHSATAPLDGLTIDIQMEAMERDQALALAASMRQIAYVDVVLTSEKRMLQP